MILFSKKTNIGKISKTNYKFIIIGRRKDWHIRKIYIFLSLFLFLSFFIFDKLRKKNLDPRD